MATPHAHNLHFLLLLLFLSLLSFTPTLTFDLGGLLSLLTNRGDPEKTACPANCTCEQRSAEDVMQDYVTRYLPDMGQHMRPELEAGARSLISLMTGWFGDMADIRCSLPPGQRRTISELTSGSSLGFKALAVRCDGRAGLVWDISSFNAFINILDIDDCKLTPTENSDSLPVPLNLWVLQIRKAAAQNAAMLDLAAAYQLLALSFTESTLTAPPAAWKSAMLPRLMYLDLSHNNLNVFSCEIDTEFSSALNLDYNQLTAVPECLLDGKSRADHISFRHNKIQSLGPLLHTETQGDALPKPTLSSIDLAHNVLTSVSKIRETAVLTALDLSHNVISSISTDAFTLAPALDWMDLSNNALDSLPDGALSLLVFLQHLNLSANHLRAFNFDQSPMSTKLATIDLRHNLLGYPPFADTGYVAPRQSRINAAKNPYFCDCDMNVFLQFVEALRGSQNRSWFAQGYWEGYQTDPLATQPFLDTRDLKCHMPTHLRGVSVVDLIFQEVCPLMRGCPTSCYCELVKTGVRRVRVNCTQAGWMTELPTEVPLLAETPIVLDVSGTNLRRLDHRPYLHLVSELHAGHAAISIVSTGAIQALQNVQVLQLHNNQLRSLPSITRNISFGRASNITLHGNPWTCGCNDLWMVEWLKHHSLAVHNPNAIMCRWSGKPLPSLSASDLSCGVFNFVPLLISLCLLLGLVAMLTSLLVKYRLEILVLLYSRFNIRPWDMFTYENKRRALFDVFVSFSQHDCRWVVEKLLDRLENRPQPYRLCIHLRDFPVGTPIADSISWAVENSRCTLLVLTRDFLSSEWCRHEFRTAHERLLRDPQAKLIVVIKGPLDARSVDRELKAYLRTHTYLRAEDKWFWSKLEYALPPLQRVPRVQADHDNLAGATDIDLDMMPPVALGSGDITQMQHRVMQKTHEC